MVLFEAFMLPVDWTVVPGLNQKCTQKPAVLKQQAFKKSII
jgi:hypothetical protein